MPVVDDEGNANVFESRSRAENWLREDEYSRVSDLIKTGQLPRDFRLPIGDDPEALREAMQERPDIQPFLDRALLDSLGPERKDVRCAHVGCSHGAIELSTFCRRHHFENVVGRPYVG